MAQRPEIVIGLIGAVGTDLKQAVAALSEEFSRIGYTAHQVRMSALLTECAAFKATLARAAGGPEDERIDAHMDAGDALRNAAGRGDAMIYLAIAHIRALRRAQGAADQALPDTVYILNSLKHPQEVETLRRIYGHNFLALSLYEPKAERKQRLQARIAQSRQAMNDAAYAERAQGLIDRDEKEAGTELGQNVRAAFPLADLFASSGDEVVMRGQFRRFVDLLFGSPFITPTVDEYGMFHAKAAALRSADLSRQVGALIASAQGEIIASGCNEVPKPGGGIHWDGDGARDYRDFQMGYDTSTRMKHELVAEILRTLHDQQWLDHTLTSENSLDALVHKAVFDDDAILAEARVSNIIEFGRMVHAEMNALMEAARRGLPVHRSRLYCTTFPCHMCARHIIAAGIAEVIYIEPYPKSMAEQLYRGAISVDGRAADTADAVVFRPFIGVAPRRFQHLFEKGKRKDRLGNRIAWEARSARPLLADNFFIYLDTEETYTMEMLSPALGRIIDGKPL